MKRTNFLFIVLLINSTLLFSQGIYFKASSNYNFSTSEQQMPRLFLNYNGSNTNKFSVASGFNFQGAAGYSFNDFLSFELKFSTLSNSQKEFNSSPLYFGYEKAEWDLHYSGFSLLPTLLLGQSFNKSSINIFVYSGFGLSKLNIKTTFSEAQYQNDFFYEYEFNRSKTFSWGYGLEYAYSISNKFSLFTNIGINNTIYKPKKAQIVSASFPIEHMTTSQKEIKYVDEITNLQLANDGSSNPDSPEVRVIETFKLNSINFGIGIKYTLKK